MLNFCLRDSSIELFHCNRHFSIKGKTSVNFPNFPSSYLKNWLTFFYISSANEVIFLFHVRLDATVDQTSLDFFFGRRRFIFFRLSVFSFFLELASSWAFFFIVLFQAHGLWRLFASSDLFQLKKKVANNKNFFKGGGSITVSVFPFS